MRCGWRYRGTSQGTSTRQACIKRTRARLRRVDLRRHFMFPIQGPKKCLSNEGDSKKYTSQLKTINKLKLNLRINTSSRYEICI
jgi:hypothetical protein